eukprot:9910396-Alexandrium_andersonii.AAC.1
MLERCACRVMHLAAHVARALTARGRSAGKAVEDADCESNWHDLALLRISKGAPPRLCNCCPRLDRDRQPPRFPETCPWKSFGRYGSRSPFVQEARFRPT